MMDTSSIFESLQHSLWRLEHRLVSRWRLTTLWRTDSEATIQRSLLRLLAISHRERLDPVTLINNFADEHRGIWRFRLRRLARRIEGGTPLVDALEHTPDVLNASQVLAIRFATQSGTLATTFEQLLERQFSELLLARAAFRRAIGYAVTLLVVMVAILTFLNVSIVPVLAKILHEFDMLDTPWLMQSFIDASRRMENLTGVWILVMGLAICMYLVAPVRRVIAQLLGPWWTRLSTQSHAAELLKLLSTSIDAGRPVSGSLSILARHHFDKVVRNRLLFARNEVEQGAEPWACLERARFLSAAEAEAVRAAPDHRLQAWTLTQLARVKASAMANRYENFAALSKPAVVLVFAAIVLWIASAFIQYLAFLIASLA